MTEPNLDESAKRSKDDPRKLNWLDMSYMFQRTVIFPLCLIIAFHWFDFQGFIIAVLVIWSLTRAWALFKKRVIFTDLLEWRVVFVPIFFGLSLSTGDHYYAQILPSISGCYIFLVCCISFWPNAPAFIKTRKNKNLSVSFHNFLFKMMALAVLVVTINEMIRSSVLT